MHTRPDDGTEQQGQTDQQTDEQGDHPPVPRRRGHIREQFDQLLARLLLQILAAAWTGNVDEDRGPDSEVDGRVRCPVSVVGQSMIATSRTIQFDFSPVLTLKSLVVLLQERQHDSCPSKRQSGAVVVKPVVSSMRDRPTGKWTVLCRQGSMLCPFSYADGMPGHHRDSICKRRRSAVSLSKLNPQDRVHQILQIPRPSPV